MISISNKTKIIIDELGIHKFYTGNIPFINRDFSYPWYKVETIMVKTLFQSIELKIKDESKKIKIPYFLWEVKTSSVDLKVKKLPKTNIGRAKFDINETAILKTINYWKPVTLFPTDITHNSILTNQIDLGKKIQVLAGFAIAGVFIYVISLSLSQDIHLHNGYYWKMWIIFSYIFLMFGLLFTQNELKNKSKALGAFLASILAATTLSTATSGILTIYTKYSNKFEIIEFSLDSITKNNMIWKSDKDNWNKIRIRFEYDFEREIKIGDTIDLKINKGPYEIYTTSIENYDLAVEKYKLE